MAPNVGSQVKSAMATDTSTAIHTAELRYERASTAIELLARDEELRKMKIRNMLLGDELDKLNEKLCDEFERGDAAELDAQDWRARVEEVTERLERTLNDLRSRTRDMEALKAELSSLQDVSADSTKLLTEKLGLSRELAHLRPEVEHLRSQAVANHEILAEKLSLQRQLSTVQAEFDNEKRTVQRLSAKDNKSGELTLQYEAQLEELRKELTKEQRERQKAEKAGARANEEQLEEVKKELAKEKRDRQRAEKAATKANEEQLEELRKKFERDKEKLDRAASKVGDERIDELRKDLANEKRERQHDEKEARKAEAEWKTQKAVLDDRLDQLRTKLRSTKERLKENEMELVKAQAAAVTRPLIAETKAKNPRKRVAVQMDPDAAIGTPGDAVAAKRGKRASSVVGEKSMFSITPFLNRTASVAPDSPPQAQEENERLDMDEPITSIENAASPSVLRSKSASTAKKPKSVLQASSDKHNSKPAPVARKKAAALNTLEKVAEEGEADDNVEHNAKAVPVAPLAQIAAKTVRPILKPKSLNSFASFRDASLPPQPQQKKKHKLLGGLGKTIFDEDDEGDEGNFGGAKSGIGGQRGFGAFGVRGFGGVSLLQTRNKEPLVVASDGFMFSPLKRDRKAMAAAAAGAPK